MPTQWEREEDQIDRDYADGLIDNAEYRKQIKELRRDYMAAAEEASENAYRNEMDSL